MKQWQPWIWVDPAIVLTPLYKSIARKLILMQMYCTYLTFLSSVSSRYAPDMWTLQKQVSHPHRQEVFSRFRCFAGFLSTAPSSCTSNFLGLSLRASLASLVLLCWSWWWSNWIILAWCKTEPSRRKSHQRRDQVGLKNCGRKCIPCHVTGKERR